MLRKVRSTESRALVAYGDPTQGGAGTPLEANEHLALAESEAELPSNFVLRLTLSAMPDRLRLAEAIARALERHPLLCATLEGDVRGPTYALKWRIGPASAERCLEWHDTPVGTQAVKKLDLARGPGVRVRVAPVAAGAGLDPGALLWLEFHPAVCDPFGAMRFTEDVLSLYHALESTPSLSRIELAALGHRGTFGLTGDELRARFVGDTAVAWSYFRGKSSELAHNDASATSCVHAASVLDEGELEQLANGARSAGATPRELLVREAVVAARGWNERHGASKSALPLRVSWLVDLRKLADAVMPAANLSGILFHDFPPGAASEEELDRAEARFIATMRYRTLRGDAMARVTLARVLGRVPGGVLRLMRPPMLRGGAGALHVAEITGALAGARLPRDPQGRARAGGVTVERVDLLPSLRPGTPVAFGAVFYADRLCLTAHAGGNDARALLDLYVGALRSAMVDKKAFAKLFDDRIARAKERRPADSLWSLPLGKRSGPVSRPGPAD